MATTQATVTIFSSDLTGDALSLSSTATLTNASSATGLAYTTGVNRITYGSAQTNTVLVAAADFSSADKAHKVYIKNLSDKAGDYVKVSVGSSNVDLGRLYGEDWAFIPYDGQNDIKITTNGALSVEYMVIYQQ